jgi:hypothetical protein
MATSRTTEERTPDGDLRPSGVPSGPWWRATGTEALSERLGRCYELSGRYVHHDADATLVHGQVRWLGLSFRDPIPHAWVVLADGSVFDPVLNLHIEQHQWDRWMEAAVEQTYTQQQSMVMTVRTGHWGPYEESDTYKGAPDGVRPSE